MKMLGFTFCIFVLSSLLFSCSSVPQTCTGREIFTNKSGTIRGGVKNETIRAGEENKYSNYSRCEWLIDAGSSDKSILLEFSSMETECSYDFVMIYDGNSFNSTTLATYSGNTLPKPVLATSGYMLIYLFSDRNYNLKGFVANYTLQDCPYNCNRNGTCANHVCLCDKGFVGEFCEKQLCPNSCNSHGQCYQSGCHCDGGYIGDDCSLPIGRMEDDVRWYSLSKSSQNFTARFGHTSAFIKSVNCIYTYGGFSLYRILDDVVRYCLNSSMWEIAIKSNPWPNGRKNHASVTVDKGFYILGGVLDNGSYSNDLWFYDTSSDNWTQKATNSSLQLEKLMDHTLTYANGWLYVIGGKKEDGLFSSDIFRINETDCESWEKLKMSGDRRLSRMVSGHTAVFHSVSNTILVYGGYRSKYSKYVVLSGYVYAFNLQYNVWSVIKNPQIVEEPTYKHRENHIPNKRAHHTSVIMGNYMVVYGGNIHIHQELETCYDNEIFLYHLGCHQWVKHPLFMVTDTHGKRRFGHSSVSAFGNIMFVIGGYRGGVLGDVTAFKFPPTIAPAEAESGEDTDYCKQYTDVQKTDVQKCIDDIECVLCTARIDTRRTGCVHRTRKRECDSSKNPILVDTPCQGICSSLLSCQSCLSHGQGINLMSSSPSNRVYQEECSWCVKSSTCTQTVDPDELCLPGEDFISGLDGWWGSINPSWNSIEQCTNNDIPAGIQVMYYYEPDNILQPDQVLFMNSFSVPIEDVLPYHGNIDETGKLITVRITGYIHPLDAPLVYGSNMLQLYLSGSGDIVATLNLSNDSSVKNQEIVIRKSTYLLSTTNLANRKSEKLFPNTTRGHKYYVAVEAEKRKKDKTSTLSLQWNIEVNEDSEIRGNHHHMPNLHPITMEFLEPYNSVHCSIHNNCLACMTDASCAWCSSSSTCLYKGDNSTKCNETYAITHPEQCDLCHDYPDCYSCVTDDLCEWSTKSEKCIRRGRLLRNLRQISECPQPCHLRKNCNLCVEKDKDECFWCENTGECFPFAHYISHHMSGQCQEWVDSDDLLHNHTCRDCSVYKSCDNCLSRYGCGWCGNVDNRMIGKCVDGDFSGPTHNQNCSVIVADVGKKKNITVADPSMWMYDKCLDVDECTHDVYDCDENASCVNTETSYICVCNKGFIQYGKECKKTCYYDCVYGKCSVDYECHCDLGYTGPDCSTDCQCNNQSVCTKGVGKCDSCQNNTNGSHCQFCLHGYYGIPSKGCKACHCNGHAETSRGQCSNVTGECFCTHNTEGEHCERCQEGYYGDPRNGGKCYRNCDNRVILNQKSGSLGSFQGTGVTSTRKHCVWIISDIAIDKVEIEEPMYDTSEISITFTIDNIVTKCGREHVYVYEGIPSFIYGHSSPDTDTGLLASFCGSETPKSVTVRSKVITVFFETGVFNHPIHQLTADIVTFAGIPAWPKELIVPGFNASYQVNDCGVSCRYQQRLQNPVCQGNKCICDAGFEGEECRKFVCSPGCLFNQDSQSCQCNSSLGPVEIFPWYTVFQPYTRLPEDISRSRYGHTLVACGTDSMYMFGGYSLRHGLLNDVWMFNLTTNKWTQIVPFTTTEPTGRYYHTAVYLDYLKTMYVFGGFVRRGNNVEATNEMWKFAIGAHKWTLEVSSEVHPVAGHTMTKIGDAKLLVIGGFSRAGYFSENMYEYDATISTWRVYTQRDLIGAPIGLYGHTAVHHEDTQSIYIYGGILYRSPRVNLSESPRVVLSDELYSFDLVSKRWNNLQSTRNSEEGAEKDKRIFHTAVDVGKYMVIFGGQSDDQQLTDKVLVYHYLCNNWHSFQFKEVQEDEPINIRVSAVSVAIETSVYIMGGYSGEVHSGMIKLTLPIDRCRLIKDEHECVRSSTGCKACIISSPDGSNVTSCYSAHIHKFLPNECFGQTLLQGKGECDKNWHLRRDCDGYTTCDSCLAVFPYFKDIRQICKWCQNCGENKCVKVGRKCTGQTCKNHPSSSPVGESHWCGIFECGTSTCERCKALNCEWTSTKGYNVEENWYCRRNKSPNITVCPAPCQLNANCQSCIRSVGAEAGSGKCVWSHALQECMSEAYKPLRCSHGNCGLLIDSSTTECLRPCHEFRQCSNCLRAPGCGWCAGNNGMGLCMSGGMKGPTGGVCNPGDIRNFKTDSPMNQYHWSIVEPIWSYISCPPENECINGHHTCNNVTQDCFDTLKGFNCSCKKGYREDSKTKECIPVCHQGCRHGICVRPDKCDCSFGYVGKNCTVECECHKNSECESVEQTKHCLSCHNNTQGTQCEHCKLWFVGSPKMNQPCNSCFNVCNNHTNRCSSVKDFKKLNASTIYSTYDYHKVIKEFNPNGPVSDPVCIRCQNNTEGRKCDGCQSGYFRHKGMTKFDACIKCQCHGHSHFCDNMTGECRPCRNNTRTRCSSDENDSPDTCWKKQCAVCEEYFQGHPVHDHQCYRQMNVDREYCLDPETQNECSQNAHPLMQGRTVFFAVQPRYLNVDIRITIDVLKGGADVFFSSSDQTFTVKDNKENGVHILELDSDLHIRGGSSQRWSYPINKRSLDNYNIHIHNIMTDLAESKPLDKRSVQNSTSGVSHELLEIHAKNFHTYHTVTQTNTILRVKNVESRLVITLPVHSHNLKFARFYIIMYGVGSKYSNNTYGNLYFRQDQPHIDLFVFFSVFFSSFFLFLAVCVLLWKMKQAVDTQRSRQQRAKEMMHMASRPFSKVLVYVEPEPIIMSSTPVLRRPKLPKIPHRNVPIMGLTPVDLLPPIIHQTIIKEKVPFDVIPIAVEPIISGSAAIRTVVIQLPGGPHASSKLCIGSTLTSNYRPSNNNPKSNTRRRPSSTQC
ncbi:multiple epidermal growth factor-like domains protein 8 [Mytilus trossulus]|uniref:multiple epidermal growth factor-like domains protein 8 n=1 Tax=Mytilus trossulus TaxID=6551 RepID=UPI0030076D46